VDKNLSGCNLGTRKSANSKIQLLLQCHMAAPVWASSTVECHVTLSYWSTSASGPHPGISHLTSGPHHSATWQSTNGSPHPAHATWQSTNGSPHPAHATWQDVIQLCYIIQRHMARSNWATSALLPLGSM
jgi:hypothetical protein